MQLIIDSANLDKIEEYIEYLPVEGVTTNPSILKKEGKIDFTSHMKKIRNLIGYERSLHIQTIANDRHGMIQDAFRIIELVDKDVFIKIPTSKEGLAAMKYLKQEGFKLTATAIYTEIQAVLAKELGVDYLAPYVNRMMNLGTNSTDLIRNMSASIKNTDSSTRILAASFKNVDQVLQSLHAGATHVTVGTDVLDATLANQNIDKAISDFALDWHSVTGKYKI